MTNEDAKKALITECPVVYGGIEYAKISGVIYRHCGGGNIRVSVELKSKQGNSVTIAGVKDVSFC